MSASSGVFSGSEEFGGALAAIPADVAIVIFLLAALLILV